MSERITLSTDRLPSIARRRLDFSGITVPHKRLTESLPDMPGAELPGYRGNGWLRAVKNVTDIPSENTANGINCLTTTSDSEVEIIDLITPPNGITTSCVKRVDTCLTVQLVQLPDVILWKIILHCDVKTAMRLSQTCYLFRGLISSCEFWEEILLRDHEIESLWGDKYWKKLELIKAEYRELSEMKKKRKLKNK